MNHFLLKFIFIFICCYCLLIALSHGIYPHTSFLSSKQLDTFYSQQSLYKTSPKYVFHELSKWKPTLQKKVFILGSSNVRAAIRPKEIQAFFPKYEIHSLAIEGSNIEQYQEIIELIKDKLPPYVYRKSIFILGIWQGDFIPTSKQYDLGKTALSVEYEKSWKIKQKNSITLANPFLLELMTPRLLMANSIAVAKDFKVRLFGFLDVLLREQKIQLDLLGNHPNTEEMIDETFIAHCFSLWKNYLNDKETFTSEQFDKLSELINQIENDLSKLQIIEMPQPEWQQKGSLAFKNYQSQLNKIIQKNKDKKHITFNDCKSIAEESDFVDYIHPKPEITQKWANILFESKIFKKHET